jgi:hypothetical protein
VQLVPATDAGVTVSGAVGPDGTFALATSKNRTRTAGAPVGEYRVTVYPPALPEHGPPRPVTLPRPFRVEAKENTLTIALEPPLRRPKK